MNEAGVDHLIAKTIAADDQVVGGLKQASKAPVHFSESIARVSGETRTSRTDSPPGK